MPSTVVALCIVVVAVLPGSVYTWAYERQASAFGVTFADRTLRFLALSVIFHLVLGWPEYVLYRLALDASTFGVGQFAAVWAAVLLGVATPAAVGTVLGGLYATRGGRNGWPRVRRWMARETEARLLTAALGRTPAPRAWDHVFSESPLTYLRVRTTSGETVAGLFADRSYAGGYPHAADLLLEDVWELADDAETLTRSLGYAVYLPADQIAWIDLVPGQAVAREV